jgi:hypothetical protein
MTKARRGRASIFRDKDGGKNVHGIITKRGAIEFEARRKELRALHVKVLGHPPTTISDADVIEFLARGEEKTALYLTLLGR